ncbi:hypothetical protein Tsubulata_032081, partial [Turnera subulata]
EMVAHHYRPNSSSFGSPHFNMLDPFSHSLGGFNEVSRGGSMPTQALVLDTEKGELVKAPASVGKKGVCEAKALAALKSHSEAERRRRERINAHLDTLRGLVPCTEKMDKATLLAEVINQVKELKKNALEASKGLLIPLAEDELTVETYSDGPEHEILYLKASLCCDYRPELLSDIRQAIESLQLKLVNAEISTLAGRVKNTFVLTAVDGRKQQQDIRASIHQALSSVLEKGSTSAEYSPRTTLPNKRRRLNLFDSSS